MGDIMEAWPNHQGFDFAAFPIHQQGQLTIFNDDAANEEVTIGIGKNNYDDRFTLDNWFRPDASHMATVVEGKRGERRFGRCTWSQASVGPRRNMRK